MVVIVKHKRRLDSYGDTYVFLLFIYCWLLLKYMAFFNFNLNEGRVESIISKQFSVLSALQVSLLTKCEIFYPFPNAP